jgi:Fe-S-cluster containining protein
MGHCKRRGYCCQDVRLAEPPELLEKAYRFWLRSPSIDPRFSEIYLIYPMLEFKFEEKDADLAYHYRCKHFTHDSEGIPACSIYDIRPRMCRDFPYYEDVEHLDRNEPLSPYEGCGYNDPD